MTNPFENLRPRPWLLTLIAVVNVLLTAAIAFDVSPFLRGPEEWRWPYALLGEPVRLLLPAAWLAVHLGLGLYWAKGLIERESRSVSGFLWFMWLSAVLVQVTLLFVTTPVIQQLFFRTASDGANGVFSVGTAINDTADYLRRYPELMPSFPIHPQRYPPGLMLFFVGARDLFGLAPAAADPIAHNLRYLQCTNWDLMRMDNPTLASATLQMALPLWSSFVIFPLYHLGRLTVNRTAAVWSVFFYPLIPAFALWIAVWDQFYPLITATAWLCFAAGLIHNRRGLVYLGGFVLGFGTFLGFGLVGILAPLGLWAAFYLFSEADWRTAGFWQRAIIDGALFFAGVVTLWALYRLFFGVGFLQIWNTAMGYHFGLDYNYWTWVLYHTYDFLLFLGIPLAILLIAAFGSGLGSLRNPKSALMPLAFGFGLLVLIFSGTSRGEVARVWLFLTPFAVLTASFMLAKMRFNGVAVVALLLAGQLLVFDANLRMITTGMIDPLEVDRQFETPSGLTGDPADFGGQLTLLGYDVQQALAGDTAEITLVWQADQVVRNPYTIFIHLLNADGEIIGQRDSMPQDGVWPTTCWKPGEIVTDVHRLPISPDLLGGEYDLMLGLYWFETGERVPIQGNPAATADQRLPIGSLIVKRTD